MQANPAIDAALWAILAKTGVDYYQALVQHWADTLDVACAFVAESLDPDGMRLWPLASWCPEPFRDMACFETEGTPCKRRQRAGPVIYPDRLAERFPDDAWIAETGMQSYVGISLLDPTGRVLGQIGVFDTKPMADTGAVVELLDAFVPRCTAEMLRTRRDLALEQLLGGSPWVLYRAAPPQFAPDVLTQEGSGFLGFSATEIAGYPDLRCHHLFDGDRERILATFAQAMDTGRGFQIHYRLWNRDRTALHTIRDYGRVERDAQGQATHIAGVLVDVTARRSGEAERHHRERDILSRLDDLPGLVFSCAADSLWQMQYVGGASRRLTGYGPEDLAGGPRTPFGDLVHPEDRDKVLRARRAAAESGDAYRIDYRLIDLHHAEHQVTENGRGIRDAEGHPKTVDGFIVDHTQEDAVLQALSESEERFRKMADTAHDAIISLDDAGCIVFWNQSATRTLGYEEDEVIGRDVHALLAPTRYRGKAKVGMFGFADTGQGEVVGKTLQLTARRKDGIEIPVELSVSSMRIAGRWYALGVMRDVSERRRSEAELLQSEARFRALFEAAADGLLIADAESGHFIAGNQRMAEQLRCSPEELTTLSVADIHPKDDLPWVLTDFHRLAGLERGRSQDIPVRRRDGTLYTASISSFTTQIDGRACVVGAFRDVTERVEAERSIQAEHARLQGYLDNAPVVTLVFNPEGQVELVNRRGCDVLGYGVHELIGRHWFREIIVPADRAAAKRAFRHCLMNPPGTCGSFEYSVTTGSGDVRRLAWVSNVLRDGDGEAVGLMVSGEDVTERRRMEEALKGTRERLQMVIDTVPAVLYACAPEEGLPVTFVGGYLREHFGIDPDEVIGRPGDWRDHVHPDDLPQLTDAYSILRRDGYLQAEFRLRCPEGLYRWVQSSVRVVTDDQGQPRELVGYLLDIGERKAAEQALREREASLAHAQSIANLGSWESDLDSPEHAWSDEVYRILGYAPRTFAPSIEHLLERVHPDDAGRVRQRLQDAIARETSFDLEFRAIRPTGDERFLRARGEIRRDEGGHAIAVAATLLDFTERKQIELSLERSRATLRQLAAHLQSVREEERTAIAREIHDEMGQALTALKIDLVRLRSRLKDRKDSGTFDLIASMLRSADETIGTVQRIMAELRPSVLDDLGLTAAIEWQTRQFAERTGIACELDVPEGALPLSQGARTTLFRILQESLTNVARHANASRVRVSLVTDTDQVALSVEDNGKGIRSEDLDDSRSFGLLGMRERATAFGGAVDIRGEADTGTKIRVTLPMHSLDGEPKDDHPAHGR